MSDVLNPDERKSLKGMIIEMTYCLEAIDTQKKQMKEIGERAEDELNIKKTYVNKMARTMFKDNYRDLQQESERFEYLYEAVVADMEYNQEQEDTE